MPFARSGAPGARRRASEEYLLHGNRGRRPRRGTRSAWRVEEERVQRLAPPCALAFPLFKRSIANLEGRCRWHAASPRGRPARDVVRARGPRRLAGPCRQLAAIIAAKSASAAVDIGLLEQLNQIRAAAPPGAARLSPDLTAAASLHSRDMLTNGFFAHASANGQAFWKRIPAFYPEGGFGYWSVGENLFWTSGPPRPARA